MLVQASVLTVHRIHATDQNPAAPPEEIGYLLKRTPMEGRPCFVLTGQ